MYDDVLIPTDGSDAVRRAVEHGVELADHTDATVHALFVVDTTRSTAVPEAEWFGVKAALEETGERAVGRVANRARERGLAVTTAVLEGEPVDTIVDYAAANADLVVMGTHGRSGIDRVVLGSVTDGVVRSTDTPVLVRRVGED